MYAGTAAVVGDRWWLARPRAGPMVVYVAVGLVVTVGLELVNVHVLGRWSYTPSMPQVWGVGIVPLIQWLALPPVTLAVTRRLVGGRMQTRGVAEP